MQRNSLAWDPVGWFNPGVMLNFFRKDPRKALQKRYEQLLLEARNLQRAGKIPEFAKKTEEAEAVRAQIDELDAASTAG